MGGGEGMKITKEMRIADILNEYDDIAEVMEVFGIQRVGRYSVRSLAGYGRVPHGRLSPRASAAQGDER
jgi:hypothetical protein